MGLLSKLFGGAGPNKEELIKSLVKERIKLDPMAESMGFNEDMVDSLGTMQLMGLPEAAIVTIVETYALSLKSGAPDEAILNHIENHRSQLGAGTMPSPLNLDSYIKYRIKIEHEYGAPISEELISRAIKKTRQRYGC